MKIATTLVSFLTVCFFIALPGSVLAASLFFTADNLHPAVGQEFSVDVFLNTENESVNAIEGVISFPENITQLKTIKDGNSLVNFWVKRPVTDQSGSAVFSGITPGGYQGAKGFLFSMLMKATSEGNGAIAFQTAQTFLNDGKGTAVTTTFSPLSISVLSTLAAASNQTSEKKDSEAPEPFTIEVSSSPDLFNGKWFLVFASQDKESGIDHYEVREGFFGHFITVQSPYLLKSQSLGKKIYVKAIDKSGNERTEIFYPPNAVLWYQNIWILGILMLIAAGIIFKVAPILWRKFIR